MWADADSAHTWMLTRPQTGATHDDTQEKQSSLEPDKVWTCLARDGPQPIWYSTVAKQRLGPHRPGRVAGSRRRLGPHGHRHGSSTCVSKGARVGAHRALGGRLGNMGFALSSWGLKESLEHAGQSHYR